MFENLSEKLGKTLQQLRGQGRLTPQNIKDSIREVRKALLDADVALPVVKDFIAEIEQEAVGDAVATSLNPGQVLIKHVKDALVRILGDTTAELNFACQPPAIILMAGLQGSGKTTTVAKLAKLLKETQQKKVLVTSADIYRPAAIEQLKRLADEVGVDHHPSSTDQQPIDIALQAIQHAKNEHHDVLIIDTAGRLHIDEDMMQEIQALHAAVDPIETLFVVDAMTGQDAANTAKAFDQALALTGVVLTKIDGDARGGAALSIRQITGKPIKFIGTGEKIDGLEAFHPDRIASRILGMGDILSLVEEVERKVDKKQTEKLAKKLKKGGFDLEDFRDQIQQMNSMGGMMSMLGKIPGMNALPQAATSQVNDKSFNQMVALINSMTPKERRFPKIISGSRKKRIAKGAGRDIPELNRLLKQFTQMQKMMKKMSKPGAMKKMMRGMPGGLGGMSDLLPPGK